MSIKLSEDDFKVNKEIRKQLQAFLRENINICQSHYDF